jgi:ferric-dicitrate binding protein FerR (iron transport regulator)
MVQKAGCGVYIKTSHSGMNEKALEYAIYIAGLLAKEKEGGLSVAEAAELESWRAAEENNRRLSDRVANRQELAGSINAMEHYNTQQHIENILSQITPAAEEPVRVIPHPGHRRWIRYAAAAVLILAAASLAWLYKPVPGPHEISKVNNEITPGGNKAVLTLADGSRITLDSAGTGSLASQGNTKILKPDSGRLVYEVSGAAGTVAYNTLSTPKGGQFMITLPDGSRVWLNAVSSLTYPTAFSGRERNVDLTGEAYFEIAENAAQPFHVHVKVPGSGNSMDVQVLGTHFNIMAYPDEKKINATLMEGAVKIMHGNCNNLLKPGEQAVVNPAGPVEIRKNVDTEEVIAWKNGQFMFKSMALTDIMRQIARWYDVEVVYERRPDIRLSGIVSRNIPIAEILKLFESNGASFRVEGKRITVL